MTRPREQTSLAQQFTDCLDDPRNPDLCAHTFLEMVRCRVFGILAAYEDQNDHDALRHDSVFKLLAGRLAAPKASVFGHVGQGPELLDPTALVGLEAEREVTEILQSEGCRNPASDYCRSSWLNQSG
jgi:hypothetical protein